MSHTCLPFPFSQVSTSAIKIVRVGSHDGPTDDIDLRSLDIPEVEAFGAIFLASNNTTIVDGLDDVSVLLAAHSTATAPVISEDCRTRPDAKQTVDPGAVVDTERLMTCSVSTATRTNKTSPQNDTRGGVKDTGTDTGDKEIAPDSSDDSEGLGTGVIVAIAIGILATVALVIAVVYRKTRQEESARLPDELSNRQLNGGEPVWGLGETVMDDAGNADYSGVEDHVTSSA